MRNARKSPTWQRRAFKYAVLYADFSDKRAESGGFYGESYSKFIFISAEDNISPSASLSLPSGKMPCAIADLSLPSG